MSDKPTDGTGFVTAPWTDAQVEALKAWQACGWQHPFTCPDQGCSASLVPTKDGWICPDTSPGPSGGRLIVQDWCHDFMLEPIGRNPLDVVAENAARRAQELGDCDANREALNGFAREFGDGNIVLAMTNCMAMRDEMKKLKSAITHPQIHIDYYNWAGNLLPHERDFIRNEATTKLGIAMFAWTRSRERMKEGK